MYKGCCRHATSWPASYSTQSRYAGVADSQTVRRWAMTSVVQLRTLGMAKTIGSGSAQGKVMNVL